MFANPEELLRYLKDEDVKFVDVRFCDLPGVMQHFNTPVESFVRNTGSCDFVHERGSSRSLVSDAVSMPMQ